MAHKPWELESMSALVEASEIVRTLADPASSGYSIKAAINSAANKMRKFNWTYNRVRDVWYARPKVAISADELKQLRRAAKLAQEEKEATDEIAQLRARLSRLESLLLAQDEEFHSENLKALRVVGRGHSGEDR